MKNLKTKKTRMLSFNIEVKYTIPPNYLAMLALPSEIQYLLECYITNRSLSRRFINDDKDYVYYVCLKK